MSPQHEDVFRHALDLFETHGVKPVTMAAVARACHTSEAAIHRLFETKDDLVQAVVAKLATDATQAYQGIRDRRASAPDEVVEAVPILAAIFCRLNRSVLDELRGDHVNSWRKVVTFRDAVLLDFIRSNLRRGQADGWYRMDLDPAAAAAARVRELVAVQESLVPPVNPDAVRQTLLDIAHRYLSVISAPQPTASSRQAQ